MKEVSVSVAPFDGSVNPGGHVPIGDITRVGPPDLVREQTL